MEETGDSKDCFERRERSEERRARALPYFFFLPLFLSLFHFSSLSAPPPLSSLLHLHLIIIKYEPRGPGPLRGPSRRAQGPGRAGPGARVGAGAPGAQDGGQGRFEFFSEKESRQLSSSQFDGPSFSPPRFLPRVQSLRTRASEALETSPDPSKTPAEASFLAKIATRKRRSPNETKLIVMKKIIP